MLSKFIVVSFLSLCFTAPAMADESSQTYQHYLETFEAKTATGERLSLVEACLGAITWACEHEVHSTAGVEFTACCTSAANLVTDEKAELNMYGSAKAATRSIAERLEKNQTIDEFWQKNGVHPANAARCAKALFDYRHADGFWNTVRAEGDLSSCNFDNLAPNLFR